MIARLILTISALALLVSCGIRFPELETQDHLWHTEINTPLTKFAQKLATTHKELVLKHANLEKGLILGSLALLAGLALLLVAVNRWRMADFGHLDYARTMRVVVPGVTLTALGFQTILSSFFTSILGMRRR